MINRTRIACTAALLTVAVSVFPAIAVAKGGSSAAKGRDSKEREARQACLEGNYAKGVTLLTDLFLDTGDPTYLFNQGRCYQQNERYPEAINRFRVETIVEKRGRAI